MQPPFPRRGSRALGYAGVPRAHPPIPPEPRAGAFAAASSGGRDHDHLRLWVGGRGVTPRIARKGADSSQRLAGSRECPRLHRRHERKAGHFLVFTRAACTLICYHRLTN